MPTKIVAACVACATGINGFWAIVFGHVLLNLPFATYQFYLAHNTLDEELELTARNLGAHFFQYYRTIILSFLWPTILKTAALIFLLCFKAVSIPFIFGCSIYHATPDVMLYKNSCTMWEKLFYALFRIIVILFLLFFQRKKSAEYMQAPIEKKLSSAKKNTWLFCYSVLAFVFLCTPLFLFAWQTINNDVLIFLKGVWNGLREPLLNNMRLLEVVQNSLLLACVSACGATIIGVMLAIIIQKKSMYTSLFHSPDSYLNRSFHRRQGYGGLARAFFQGSQNFNFGIKGCAEKIKSLNVKNFFYKLHPSIQNFLQKFHSGRATKMQKLKKEDVFNLFANFMIFLPLVLGASLIRLLTIYTHFSPKMSALFCHIFINYPFAYFIMQTQMALCSQELYFLAQSLGADRRTFFSTVQFPLMRNALITAWCVAFGLSMTEAVGTGENFLTIPHVVRVYRVAGKTTEVVGMSVVLLTLVGMIVGCVRGVGWLAIRSLGKVWMRQKLKKVNFFSRARKRAEEIFVAK